MSAFFERRFVWQRILWVLFSATFGYLVAFYTIQPKIDGIDIEYILHDPLVTLELSRQTRSLLSFGQKSDSCQCQTTFYGHQGLKVNYFGNSFGDSEAYELAKKKRAERLVQWEKRELPKTPIRKGTVLYTTPIPIIYPYYGLKMKPMSEMSIPALRLLPLSQINEPENRNNYPSSCSKMEGAKFCCAIYSHYGDLLLDDVPSDTILSYDNLEDKKSFTISTNNIVSVNRALGSLRYQNTQYEPRGATDVITVRYASHKAQIPILIKHDKQPVLIDPGQGLLDDMVTICIKTFERYPCLYRLIDSIRSVHPKIKIIIADDSINYENINLPNVDQFKMPPAIGFNNGKNLAISQVTTEYLLWVDDDFHFFNQTDLSWMMNVLEETDLDIIGGKAGSSRWGYSSNLRRLSGGADGDCLYRTYGNRGEVPGYPTCVLADVIQNFYMARTLSLRAVGFDGLFKRISHKEFFLDGLGRLKIAQCSNIEINHDHGCISNNQKKVYMKYREPDTAEYDFIDQTWFYRSNLQCIAEKKMYGTNKFFNLTDSKT